ncbi:magnesium transporter CorA family protein [Heyndrickxia ginsengihumi]|uniref:Magnesium transporter CorA n=1 Tax=Heyndrickxia ginsengihumi TaxID=363870 RepID=A0A0A6VAZ3_9BACI|nr:magnesium transporter CorA family protein [Heyndrickxia ginsengihumi]KHD84766.1 magnesium transporter CorA [Heyndrickxia ginsengihumi]MBE6184689.1 magnesium transporter CorA [Bacillus sp. (in: firmicutes)]MCM3024738.1 magnesium transporter CorA family protein [Heyndrickxia ginsengihumi]NEY19812.1 magnesium transporter CorA [Heyndrickxia ginsengihumi]
MIHLSPNDWTWFHFEDDHDQNILSMLQSNKDCMAWYETLESQESNFLSVEPFLSYSPIMKGSCVYYQHVHNREESELFHFYITEKMLVTVGLKFEMLEHSTIEHVLAEMKLSHHAIEAFFVILSELVKNYLYNIDDFELKLNQLLWDIRKHNNINILENIHQRRHELLIWKNMIIPLKEILIGLEEICDEDVFHLPQINRFNKKIKRCAMLLDEYQQEIDALVNLEDVVSNFRGNSIMKTLTVLTTLFTPVSAWGALWGMNFKHMPELGWKYGYLFSIVIISLNTILLYIYLYKKGWTGDILKVNKKHTFFK